MNAKVEGEKVVYVERAQEEEVSGFATMSKYLMYMGPIIQTILILVVSFYGYKWVTTAIDWTGWAVRFGSSKSPEALLLRTQGWLIFASFFFMVVQIVGALLMPFNMKVSQVMTVALSVVPIISILYVVFSLWHLDLKLDDLQRTVLWFQFWSVAGGFLLGLGSRMAIMSGRKTGNVIPGT